MLYNLFVGILWALTSGSGVAVALLQGSAGPLIGVAISASLLPPVVNCVSFSSLFIYHPINPSISAAYSTINLPIYQFIFGGKNFIQFQYLWIYQMKLLTKLFKKSKQE